MAYMPKMIVFCTICGNPAIARRLCRSHYNQQSAQGNLGMYAKLSAEDVFDKRYKALPSGCWEWTGSHNDFGYGLILIQGRQIRAHRYSYERSKGKIPPGKVIMHKCDNPPCVNPDHLEIGTRLENNKDAARKKRTAQGSKHWNSKLTESACQRIAELSKSMQQIDIAEMFGVHQSHISKLLNGHRRRS